MDKPTTSRIRVIVTGTTGMVGEGVLNECLQHDEVEHVLVINRKACGITHTKLSEIVHADFYNVSPIEDYLMGYNACFFCLGVSSVGMKEDQYYHLTYELTLYIAEKLRRLNPDMTFCYISGAGTDSTEKGKLMWARVKGKTENSLLRLPFKAAYNFRPGILAPIKGMKNTHNYYKYMGWLIPLVRKISPKYVCTLKELGQAMINAATVGYNKPVLEVPDIVSLAKKQ